MNEFEPSPFGERLRSLRQTRKLTQADLAERAGVTDETVSRVERGAFEPALSTAIALAQALGTPLDALTGSGAEEASHSLPRPIAPSVQKLVDLVLALDSDAQMALLRMAELLYAKRSPVARARREASKTRVAKGAPRTK